MLTTRQKSLVQESWAHIRPMSGTAASLFYYRLFEIDPSLKPMFAHLSMEQQGEKLIQMMTFVVRGLDTLDDLIRAIAALGRRHAGYGVKDVHYASVGTALLWTLEKSLEEQFTAETAGAWAAMYRLLTETMMLAARSVERAA